MSYREEFEKWYPTCQAQPSKINYMGDDHGKTVDMTDAIAYANEQFDIWQHLSGVECHDQIEFHMDSAGFTSVETLYAIQEIEHRFDARYGI